MTIIQTPTEAAIQAALTGQLLKALASGNVTSLPAAVDASSRPASLTGTVVPPPAGSSAATPVTALTVQTAAGPVMVQLNTAIAPPQGIVALQIQPGSPPTATLFATAPAAAAPQTDSMVSSQVSTVATPATALAAPPLAAGQVVTAISLPIGTLPPIPNAPGQSTSVLPGTVPPTDASPTEITQSNSVASPSTVTAGPGLTNANLPASQSVPVAAKTSATVVPFAPAAQAGGGSVQTSISGPQAPLNYLIVNLRPPGQAEVQQTVSPSFLPSPANTSTNPAATSEAAPATQPSPPTQFQPFAATVVAQTPAGQPLLASQNGPMLLTQPATTQIGTALTLRQLGSDETSALAPRSISVPLPLAITGRQTWPALAQLLDVLSRIEPEAAGALAALIPKTGSELVKSLLAYLTPVPGNGVPASQVHPATSTATRSLEDIHELRLAFTQLASDLGATGKAGATVKTDWHAYPVPLQTDLGLAMLQLYVRQQIDPDDPDRPSDAVQQTTTRFVVEVAPSELGPVQLDGLLRKDRTAANRLDLIVRTEFAIPQAAGQEMNALFQAALGATGISGNLGFQTGRENYVQPASGIEGYNRKA